jgi:hypothetical protein
LKTRESKTQAGHHRTRRDTADAYERVTVLRAVSILDAAMNALDETTP